MRRLWAQTLFLVIGAVSPALAQDVMMGEEVARNWCAGCHAIGRETPGQGNDLVPSFASVARMSSTTETSLEVFLKTPHVNMPDYSLTHQQIRDVSAYILSLRARR